MSFRAVLVCVVCDLEKVYCTKVFPKLYIILHRGIYGYLD